MCYDFLLVLVLWLLCIMWLYVFSFSFSSFTWFLLRVHFAPLIHCYFGHFWIRLICTFMYVIVVIQSVAVAYANLYAKTTFKAKVNVRRWSYIHHAERALLCFCFLFLVKLHRCYIYFNIYVRKKKPTMIKVKKASEWSNKTRCFDFFFSVDHWVRRRA